MDDRDIYKVFEKMEASDELLRAVENTEFLNRAPQKKVLNYNKIILPLLAFIIFCFGTGGVAHALLSGKKYTSELKVYVYSEKYNVLGKKTGWYQDELEDKLSLYVYYTRKKEVEKNDIYIMKNVAAFENGIKDGSISYEDFQAFDAELMNEYSPILRECFESGKLHKIYNTKGEIIGFEGEGDEANQGRGSVYLISAACAKPKRALILFNYMVSDEGYMTAMFGPKEVCWYISDAGEYLLTDKGHLWKNNPDAQLEVYGSYTAGKPDIPSVWGSKHLVK